MTYTQKKPTVILHLYHGRKDINENLDNWGFDGARIECEAVGFTYTTIWYVPVTTGDREELKITGDCIEYEGAFYGDFEVYAPGPQLTHASRLFSALGNLISDIDGRFGEFPEDMKEVYQEACAAIAEATGGMAYDPQ